MLKYISRIIYTTTICCLLSGCDDFKNISLYVKNSSIQQPIKKTDRIIIITSLPYFENFLDLTKVQLRTKHYFQERGYTVVNKNSQIKPNVFILLEPKFSIQPQIETHTVCTRHFVDWSQQSSTDSLNNYIACDNVGSVIYKYIYDFNFSIYRPQLFCNDINQCINYGGYKQNIFFTSHIHYETQKTIKNTQMFLMMVDAILATFPLNQNSLVTFQQTPAGYTPTQIKKLINSPVINSME